MTVVKDEIPNLTAANNTDSPLLVFLKEKTLYRNYVPIIIKLILEKGDKSDFTVSIKEIRENFDKLNFNRDDYNFQNAIISVNNVLDGFVSFTDDVATLNLDKLESSDISECMKICGQIIARYHISELTNGEFNLYHILPGSSSENFKYLDEFLSTNSIGVGWNKIGNISNLSESEVRNEFYKSYPEGFSSFKSFLNIKPKDIVVLTKGQKEIIDFGIVTGDYVYSVVGDLSYPHRKEVIWLNQGIISSEKLPKPGLTGFIETVSIVRTKRNMLIQILLGTEAIVKDDEDLWNQVKDADMSEINKIRDILKQKKNVILYGPPGTGKTYTTEKIKENWNNKSKSSYDVDNISKKQTWKEFAASVLLENNGRPLHYKEITKRIVDNSIKYTSGKTPEETLRRDIDEDIKVNSNSIFKKTDDGVFGLDIPTTFLKAAQIILFSSEKPLHSDEITKIAFDKNMILQRESPGITPERSMNQVLSQDIKNSESIFGRVAPGVYTLKSKNFNSNQNFAIVFTTDEGSEKIQKMKKFIDEKNKILWGVGWNRTKLNRENFPVEGYVYFRGEIIAVVRIIDFTSHEDTSDSDLKLSAKILGYGEDRDYYLHIDKITLVEPFSYEQLELEDDNKELPFPLQQCVYVKPRNLEKNEISMNDSEIYTRFVTFHPSYSYEDFVEGIRPIMMKYDGSEYVNSDKIGYSLEDGIFKEICEDAKNHKNSDYLLIIDEINRGNISKIFGELITLIEADKRDSLSLHLAYSKKPFTVPENLYILGTMNTADKSLVQLDTALRRRFAFVELMPKYDLKELEFPIDVIINKETTKKSLSQILQQINEILRSKGLKDKQIGHSYFLKITKIQDLQFTFQYEIIPLLQDYFYDDYNKLAEVLGDKIIDTKNMIINQDVINDPMLFSSALGQIFKQK